MVAEEDKRINMEKELNLEVESGNFEIDEDMYEDEKDLNDEIDKICSKGNE